MQIFCQTNTICQYSSPKKNNSARGNSVEKLDLRPQLFHKDIVRDLFFSRGKEDVSIKS